ncbi:uncharacterized protein LOC21404143 [Morus notabilis]|uniref:uncharacterized protein LOC21404143 n=1 Tax=Morus notabilis TaxID=981085 RepID=UPI000CECE4F6|nr:uncharacterized protein LOC21404143 [Morus notabilis]
MSGFEGSSLQNPSDHEIRKFEITGREIVPYVPQKFDKPQSVKASSPVVEGGRASSSTSSAKNEVVEAVPLSYRLPEDCDVQSAEMRLDTYYHHVESNTSLRSVVEVVNFLLYEENPYKQKRTQNKSNTSVEGGDHERKRTRSGTTMKKPPAHPNSQSSDSEPKETCSTPPTTNITVSSSRSDRIVREREIHKNILLEQFLADAHNNFLNSHSTNFAPRSSDTRDENDAKEEGVHFGTDSEATEESDMEELLRKAYNNREFSKKKKKNVTTQGINKRKRSENSNHEEDRSNIDSEETYSELSTKADEETIDNTCSGARIACLGCMERFMAAKSREKHRRNGGGRERYENLRGFCLEFKLMFGKE